MYTFDDCFLFKRYKKKYKGCWNWRCSQCETIIKVPIIPEQGTGFYNWSLCHEKSPHGGLGRYCTGKCADEAYMRFKENIVSWKELV
jgi:hypothetical protein